MENIKSIKDLHDDLVAKKISLKELADFYLSRIDKMETDVNSFIYTRSRDDIYEEIKEKENQIGDSFLYGIPAGVKDIIVTKGIKSTGGSRILDNYTPPYNATVIDKLERVGYLLFGKNNCDEFAMGSSNENSAYGVCKNPISLDRVPGGSSGGSAAAVSAGFVQYSLGTDTGGSVRTPASFCGVVGFKPSYGRVSRYGLMAMGSSLDQIGVLANSVDDARTVFDEIQGVDRKDATTRSFENKYLGRDSVKGVRIGVPKDYFQEGLDGDVKAVILKAIETLQDMGADIVDIEIPSFKYVLPVYYVIMFAEVSSNMSRYDGIRYGLSLRDDVRNIEDLYKKTRTEYLGNEVKRRIMLGSYVLSKGYFDEYYGKAQKARFAIKNDFKKAFEKVDFIVGPTTPTPAFKIGEKSDDPLQMYLTDIYTVSANLVGAPAISVPAGFVERDGDRLPVGFQMMANIGEDYNLLDASSILHKNLSF